MKKIAILTPLLVALPVFADGPHFHADLIGFNEVPSISTAGHGTFDGVAAGDWQSINWTLSFDGLQSPVAQAHIHFAQTAVNGPIVIWLCGTAALPGPAGTQPAQQLRAGDIGDMILAMEAGFAYANIHTTISPGGEIRGQINPPKH